MATRARPMMLPEAEVVRRVRLAGEELDEAPAGRFRWLIAFANREPGPEKWLPADVDGAGWRLLACALGPVPPNLVAWTDPDRPRAPLSAADVARFHRELRAWFARLVGGEGGPRRVPVPTEGYTMTLVRATAAGAKPTRFAISHGGPLRTMLFQRAAQWIAEGAQLVACRQCGRPVLCERKRLFCPPPAKCLQLHHDGLKIAKRREEAKGAAR